VPYKKLVDEMREERAARWMGRECERRHTQKKELYEAAASINIFEFILLRNSISLELLAFIIVVFSKVHFGRGTRTTRQKKKNISHSSPFLFFFSFLGSFLPRTISSIKRHEAKIPKKRRRNSLQHSGISNR
jgi:hypothetical protein